MELLRYISNQKAFAMKLKLILILIVLLSGCNNKKDAIELNKEVIIDITDKDKYLENLLEHRPDRQVKIYETKSPLTGSDKLAYYVKVNSKKIDRLVFMGFESEFKYTKAAYKWVNDSIVNFRVFNTTNRLSAHFTYLIEGTDVVMHKDSMNNVP